MLIMVYLFLKVYSFFLFHHIMMICVQFFRCLMQFCLWCSLFPSSISLSLPTHHLLLQTWAWSFLQLFFLFSSSGICFTTSWTFKINCKITLNKGTQTENPKCFMVSHCLSLSSSMNSILKHFLISTCYNDGREEKHGK